MSTMPSVTTYITYTIAVIIIFIIVGNLLIYYDQCYYIPRQSTHKRQNTPRQQCTTKREGFSLSKKPFEEEWSLLNRNPFDDIDYETPKFYSFSNSVMV